MRLLTSIILIQFILMINSADKATAELTGAGQDQEPLFSFGIIADVQYADSEPAGTRFYRSSLNKLREAVTTFRNDSVDFVITLGDMIDKDIESYEPLLNIMDSSGLRFYHITGNHDYSVNPKQKKRLPSAYASEPGYYSFTHHNFRFIFLNGNEISLYGSASKAKIRQASAKIETLKKRGQLNAVEWNGGISGKQLAWMDSQMDEALAKNEKVFLLCHFPVYPENIHNLLNYEDVLSIIGKYRNSVAWINGHNHAGNYGHFNSTHFITLKGMVETMATNSFARVDVYGNKIRIKGSGREKSQTLVY